MARTSLRDQQREFTRELIFEAVIDVILEEGVHAFTIQRVAERAGVSHRTVYRYFPTKEVLLEEMSDWSAQQLLEAGLDTATTAVDHLHRLFALRAKHERWARAWALLRVESRFSSSERAERMQGTREELREMAPLVTDEERDRVLYILHTLGSTVTWVQMLDDWDISSETAADAVAHAVQLLLADLERRNRRAARAQKAQSAPSGTSTTEDRGDDGNDDNAR